MQGLSTSLTDSYGWFRLAVPDSGHEFCGSPRAKERNPEMLDLNFVRDNLELVNQKMGDRGLSDVLVDFESLDRERRRVLMEVEGRKASSNKVSVEIASLKKRKQDASA